MDQYLGEVRMFAGNFAPKGWQLCNGQLLPIQQYAALFSLIGTFYGGNGTTTFALPNLQSATPLHWGTGPGLSTYVIGETTGIENTTLLQQNLPAHSHLVRAVSATGDQSTPANFYLASGTDAISGDALSNYSDSTTPDVTLNVNSVGIAGSNLPAPVLQPLLAVTFIIALTGVFPSRN